MIKERVKNSKNMFTLNRRFLRCSFGANAVPKHGIYGQYGHFSAYIGVLQRRENSL